jgi:hypothetical protein
MKGLVITLALAGLASTATLNAQVYGSRPLPSTNTSINVDGSWRAVGRDGSGNTIYERRTQDRNGNILVQRAVRDSRGNMSIISSSTVNNSGYGVGTSVDGSWRVVGRDGSGNTIYERRTQDRNGNILVQRAVRDSRGNMSIISSSTVNNSSYGVGTSVDGSWRVVGRDGSGNTIYERRTQDRNGNILVQRAVRDSRGNMSIISSNTVGNNGNGGYNSNCSYNQSTNTVGDIIFGRSGNNVNCNDNGNRVDGGWYQVGQGRDNNSIYERRVRDSNGNLIIQRARRNSNGSFTILSSRAYNGNNDKQWQKAQREQQKEIRKQQQRDNQQYNQQNDQQYNQSQRDNNDDRGRGKGNNGQDRGKSSNKHSERN